MIGVRALLLSIVFGAVVALLVRELNEFGLAYQRWTFTGPRVGEALVTGALIGAVSQLLTHTKGRR